MNENNIFKFFTAIGADIKAEGDFYYLVDSRVFDSQLYVYHSKDSGGLKVFAQFLNEILDSNDFINFYIDNFSTIPRDKFLKVVNSTDAEGYELLKAVSDGDFYSFVIDSKRIDSIIEYKDYTIEDLNREYFQNIFYSDRKDAIGFPLFFDGHSNNIYFCQDSIDLMNKRPGFWISKTINKTADLLFSFCPIGVMKFYYSESFKDFIYVIPNPECIQASYNRFVSSLKDTYRDHKKFTFVYDGNVYETLPLFKTYLALLNSYLNNIVVYDSFPLDFSIAFENNHLFLRFITAFKETQAVINRAVLSNEDLKETIFSMRKQDKNIVNFSIIPNAEIMISFIKLLQDFYKPPFQLDLVNPLCEYLN